jgi:hypothetical protein
MKGIMISIWISFQLLTFSSVPHSEMHDIHLSTTEIEWTEDDIHLSIRIFKDDLLNALMKKYRLKDVPETVDETKRLIESYLIEKMIIHQEGRQIAIHLEALEPGLDAFGCEFNIDLTQIDPSNLITIQNKILFELFDDQTNIVQISHGKKKKVLTFDRKNDLKEVKF